MHCEQAQQLFDAYLAGELSPSLKTEFGAHRLACSECRRALALLEVAGHVIASDQEPSALDEVFTDRLIACVDRRPSRLQRYTHWGMYAGLPMAAAAVVLLAFLGVFDWHETKIAGDKQLGEGVIARPLPSSDSQGAARLDGVGPGVVDEGVLRGWIDQTQENVRVKQQSGASLQQAIDLKMSEFLDAMRKAKESPAKDADGTDEEPATTPDETDADTNDPADDGSGY